MQNKKEGTHVRSSSGTCSSKRGDVMRTVSKVQSVFDEVSESQMGAVIIRKRKA